MTCLLAIESSASACSTALYINGEIIEQFEQKARQHARALLPMINRQLAEASLSLSQLDALAFGCGPGSFTGLRIAAAAVQGLAFGTDLPVVAISSLQILAQGVRRETGEERILTVVDAHMGEVYWGAYESRGTQVEALTPDSIGLCADVRLPEQWGDNISWAGAGNGWCMGKDMSAHLAEHAPKVLERALDQALPHAQDLAELAARSFAKGEAVAADQALPLYLRGKDAWRKQ